MFSVLIKSAVAQSPSFYCQFAVCAVVWVETNYHIFDFCRGLQHTKWLALSIPSPIGERKGKVEAKLVEETMWWRGQWWRRWGKWWETGGWRREGMWKEGWRGRERGQSPSSLTATTLYSLKLLQSASKKLLLLRRTEIREQNSTKRNISVI